MQIRGSPPLPGVSGESQAGKTHLRFLGHVRSTLIGYTVMARNLAFKGGSLKPNCCFENFPPLGNYLFPET